MSGLEYRVLELILGFSDELLTVKNQLVAGREKPLSATEQTELSVKFNNAYNKQRQLIIALLETEAD